MSDLKKITHTFMSGKVSSTVVIPISVARKYGLDKPVNVLVEETTNGILLRKLDLEGMALQEPAHPQQNRDQSTQCFTPPVKQSGKP